MKEKGWNLEGDQTRWGRFLHHKCSWAKWWWYVKAALFNMNEGAWGKEITKIVITRNMNDWKNHLKEGVLKGFCSCRPLVRIPGTKWLQIHGYQDSNLYFVLGEDEKLTYWKSRFTEIRLIASSLADGISNDRWTRANCNKGGKHW